MTEQGADGRHAAGLFASLRIFASTLTAIARTRLELLADELEEEKLRFGRLLLFGSVALFCLAVGSAFLAVFVTVLLWDSHRLLALGGFAALFLGAGAAAALLFRAHASARSRLFSASLAELDEDRRQLSP